MKPPQPGQRSHILRKVERQHREQLRRICSFDMDTRPVRLRGTHATKVTVEASPRREHEVRPRSSGAGCAGGPFEDELHALAPSVAVSKSFDSTRRLRLCSSRRRGPSRCVSIPSGSDGTALHNSCELQRRLPCPREPNEGSHRFRQAEHDGFENLVKARD